AAVRRDVQEGVQLPVDTIDPAQVGVGDLQRGHLAGRHRRGAFRRGHPGQLAGPVLAGPVLAGIIRGGHGSAGPGLVVHGQSSARIRGTRNRCCSTAGAWSSALSGPRVGTSTSSRNTLVTGTPGEVSGIPSAATSWTCATADGHETHPRAGPGAG